MKYQNTNLAVAATCLLALGSSISSSHAAIIVNYGFETDATPTTVLTNTSSSTVTGVGFQQFARSTSGNFFGRGVDTTATTDYISFTITADTGFTLDLTQLDFDYYVQQEGNDTPGGTFEFQARSSADGFASDIVGTYSLNPAVVTAPYQDATFNLSGGSYDGLSSIEFRFYATSKDGDEEFNDIVRWDNIDVTGDVAAVPEPSSAALLGLGGLALILRRRK
jgi:hypothetical protein